MEILLNLALIVFYLSALLLGWRLLRALLIRSNPLPGAPSEKQTLLWALHPNRNLALLISGGTLSVLLALKGELGPALSLALSLAVLGAFGGKTLRS